MNYSVVIPAAGEGKRMNAGKNKLWLELDGKPLIVHTLSVFQNDPACEAIIVAVNPAEKQEMAALFARFSLSKAQQLVPGGAERQDSVYKGLKTCGSEGIVLIHDGARPFVTVELIQRLIARAKECGAAIPGVPVKDTIKKAADGMVIETLKRSSLWVVQTPQAFRLSLVKEAHEKAEKAGTTGTDDASLVEKLGQPVSMVESDYDNIKITTPDDLVTARAILAKRREGERG
ncbi:MAG TPA: 2-C-methyl-D-erythritol 4-phosphate cytidylyltransferase [Bacillales bacterium]|nr:2-C-methyl-D-erythritol 4-phosphate cytidylyltransferase [Bacillales bacterium]